MNERRRENADAVAVRCCLMEAISQRGGKEKKKKGERVFRFGCHDSGFRSSRGGGSGPGVTVTVCVCLSLMPRECACHRFEGKSILVHAQRCLSAPFLENRSRRLTDKPPFIRPLLIETYTST